MTRHSIEPRTRKYIKGYRFLSFARNLSNKYEKQLLDTAKKPRTNNFHNILRLFDVLPNFPFTTSETMRDYCLETWYIRAVLRVAE